MKSVFVPATACEGSGRGAKPGDGFDAAYQGKQSGHFRTALAPGERAPERQEERLAAAPAPLPQRSRQLPPGLCGPVDRIGDLGRGGEEVVILLRRGTLVLSKAAVEALEERFK